MVTNKLKTQLETKLSKLGFKKQINDGVLGKFDVMNISKKGSGLSLDIWYECNTDIVDENEFHYCIFVNNDKTMYTQDIITYKTERGTLNWVNKFLELSK
jgi:hypothetical protein